MLNPYADRLIFRNNVGYIRQTPILAETVLQLLGKGYPIDYVLTEFPELSVEDIYACLWYDREYNPDWDKTDEFLIMLLAISAYGSLRPDTKTDSNDFTKEIIKQYGWEKKFQNYLV
jgi:Protein of unknown function (DUF433)